MIQKKKMLILLPTPLFLKKMKRHFETKANRAGAEEIRRESDERHKDL